MQVDWMMMDCGVTLALVRENNRPLFGDAANGVENNDRHYDD